MRNILEINPHVWLREQSWSDPKNPDLARLPDEEIQRWARRGIDAVWFLGVWTKGAATRRVCLECAPLRAEFEAALPGHTDADIIGSPFSIARYALDPSLGDDRTLGRLRARLRSHGIALLLDFVPNHLAADHPWTLEHPDRFVRGDENDLARSPSDYYRPDPARSDLILAHGRDPYFPGWTDTAQINIFNPATRRAATDLLLSVADRCDGVRCDMAMLLVNDVFRQTWPGVRCELGESPAEFWPEVIAEVKRQHPDFIFIAEVYWGRERQLLDFGFDYAYDKSLYDHLRHGDGDGVREHLVATADIQEHLVRFCENHDEPRAAEAFGSRQKAVATFLAGLAGTRLYHDGQFTGRRLRLPVQLGRRPDEPIDMNLFRFYEQLLAFSRPGAFRRLCVRPAWEGNPSHDAIVTYWLEGGDRDEDRLVAVNLAGHQAQCYTEIPLDRVAWDEIDFRDLLADIETVHRRPRRNLAEQGLYLDMAPGEYRLFSVSER